MRGKNSALVDLLVNPVWHQFRIGGKILFKTTGLTANLQNKFYLIWLQFLIRYRRTAIGPLWLLVGPALFIIFLGSLFSRVASIETSRFIPHLTIGLITWTLIHGFVTNSTTVFQRARPQILQSGLHLKDIIILDMGTTILQFMHQLVLIFIVMLYYQNAVSLYALTSLIGLLLLIANGYWLAIVFGIIGARYRDLNEITQASMRIAFLATPIIWMPGAAGRGGTLGPYLTFNPFYHFLEIVRAPLLNQSISQLSWIVVISVTVLGGAAAHLFYNRYHKQVPLWV